MPVLIWFTPCTTFSIPFVAISTSGTAMVNKLDLLCLSSSDLPFHLFCNNEDGPDKHFSFIGWHSARREHWKDSGGSVSSRFQCAPVGRALQYRRLVQHTQFLSSRYQELSETRSPWYLPLRNFPRIFSASPAAPGAQLHSLSKLALPVNHSTSSSQDLDLRPG